LGGLVFLCCCGKKKCSGRDSILFSTRRANLFFQFNSFTKFQNFQFKQRPVDGEADQQTTTMTGGGLWDSARNEGGRGFFGLFPLSPPTGWPGGRNGQKTQISKSKKGTKMPLGRGGTGTGGRGFIKAADETKKKNKKKTASLGLELRHGRGGRGRLSPGKGVTGRPAAGRGPDGGVCVGCLHRLAVWLQRRLGVCPGGPAPQATNGGRRLFEGPCFVLVKNVFKPSKR